MTIYTGTADGNGDFSISFGSNSYNSGEKITVTAEKDSATKSIELFAPSGVVGVGAIQFSGTLDNFPNNIGVVTISGMTSIPNYAFVGNSDASQSIALSKATGLVIGEGITSVGSNAFSFWKLAKSITLPLSCISYGTSCFDTCSAVDTAMIFNDNVVSLGVSCCSSMISVPLLDCGVGITKIPNICFGYMYALKKAIFRGQVVSFGNSACASWSACEEIILYATTPPTIATNTFSSLKSTCIFKVPAGSVAAYQAAANWSNYAARIQAI